MASWRHREPFYCEDPKAVNVLIHALFTESKPLNSRASVRLAEFASRKDEVSFIRKISEAAGRIASECGFNVVPIPVNPNFHYPEAALT